VKLRQIGFRAGPETLIFSFPQARLDGLAGRGIMKVCIVMHKKRLFCALKTMNKIKAKEIILEQKKEIKNILKGKIIEREIEREIEQSLKDNLVKVIIGVRRSGKSILAHRLLENKRYGYINFDDERLLAVKTKDLNDLLEILKEIEPSSDYLLFDEIQNVAGWELFVNRLKRSGHKIVITGSNSKLLSGELATHLTGRHFEIELYPFSFKEFLHYQGKHFSDNDFYLTNKRALIKKELNNYLRAGGFPELFKIQNKEQYLKDLHNKIINRDIIERHNIKYVKTIKEISIFLLTNFGSKITYHKIKNTFDIKSVHTAKKYVSCLEDAYLISELLPFSFKVKEQVKKPRKVYGIDLGLIKAVSSEFSPNTGRAMENIVFLELKRRGKEIYYYTSANDKEVDFVIKQGLKPSQLIQVCFNLENKDTVKREIDGLLRASQELKCGNLLVITWDEEKEEKIKGKTIKFIPLWKWLLREK